jgi:uncharacterized coiled-coil protein SlyX
MTQHDGDTLAKLARVERQLEERQLFLERDLEELSSVVASQGLLLEQLQAELRDLRQQQPTAAPGESPRTLDEERPPHH